MTRPTVFRDPISEVIKPPGNLSGLRSLIAAEPGAVMLESTSIGPWGRYSVYAARPVQSFEGDPVRDVFADMDRLVGGFGAKGERPALPFAGGWFGYLAYEAGQWTEPTAHWRARAMDLPLAKWGLYESVLLHDHSTDEWSIVGLDLGSVGVGFSSCAGWWRELLIRTADCPMREALASAPRKARWTPSRDEYLRQVRSVLDYLRAGDVYQVNVARRLRIAWESPAVELYDRLCGLNPATHAAYVGVAPRTAIVSASPELFVESRGGVVMTRPIKGTRPRTGEPSADECARRELAVSMKDRAELNMIIDLLRNDLGRVCEVGSVQVESDGTIETLPTVFHRTATLSGRLRGTCGPIELLRATFPGGSVTGAPKVRAMQIIQEMEGFARGPYCGAIGWIGVDGDMIMSLPIRTMLVHDGLLDLFVGSGIVADSDPASEFAELEAKAAGMLAAIDGTQGRQFAGVVREPIVVS